MFLAIVCLLMALTSVTSFAPISSPAIAITQQRGIVFPLNAADYDSYVAGETKEMAVKDVIVGDGNEAKEGAMVTVEYIGRIVDNPKEYQNDKFFFKLGNEENVMEGWHQGIPGMKVGGTRLLRIPPGDLAKGPPGEDLEFEIKLTEVSEGPINEFLVKNGLGANAKTYGIIALIIISALLPQLEKAGILK